MKIAIVHNAYGRISGEEVVIDGLAALLGHNFYGYSYRFQFAVDIGGFSVTNPPFFITDYGLEPFSVIKLHPSLPISALTTFR